MAALRRYRAIARGVYERVLLPPFGHWCSGGRYRAKTTQRSRHGQPASGRCDPLTGDRHRVRELIGEWIVYPFGTRMRETHRSAGGAAPVSAIAAAPLAPRPRDNSREKRPHSLRSIAAEISDCCRQYHASSPAISRVFIDGSLSPVAEPSSCAADPGASPTKIWREPGFTISIRYWPGRSRNGESTSTGSQRWDSAL